MTAKLLVANRGEVAVRVARAADAIGLPCVAVFAADDAASPHVEAAGQAVTLGGEGPAAYLDPDAIVAAARETGCTHVHPGWGFLSERAAFARACADAGLVFVGPSPTVLEHLGDKVAARALAQQLGVPVPQAASADGPAEAGAFMRELGGPIMLKAVAGGGGRGMRAVLDPAALDDAWRRCAAEAELATGSAALYAEQLVPRARHVEVQLAGDGTGDVAALGDRDCSLQRRHQKLVEIAPAPDLPGALRAALADAALAIGRELRLAGLATCEFLVDLERPGAFVFIEANPRLQVEHTVTEEVLGLDLVAAQLRLALGSSLAELELADRAASGFAVQARVNAERLAPDGAPLPTSGTLTRFGVPAGVRVDTAARAGMAVDPRYDSLLAKVVGRGPSLAAAIDATRDGLAELEIAGVDTNVDLLAAILADEDVRAARLSTDLLEDRIRGEAAPAGEDRDGPVAVGSPLTGVVVDVVAPTGTAVAAGAPVLVVEAMKMHHEVVTPVAGEVGDVAVHPGNQIHPGDPLFHVVPGEVAAQAHDGPDAADLDAPREDLARVLERRAGLLDDARPDAVRKRRDRGRRTARENLGDLVDDGTFSEYGGLVIAAQRARRSEEDLIASTPGDGIVLGTAEIGGVPAAVLSYDYTVMAGTQGYRNHQKTDRLLDLAERRRLPMVVFAEGGGGRPGDTDFAELFQLTVPTFASFARLSGLVPRIGVVSGNCFAGNAALAGCCDVLIATPEASIGMGGPAMIEGGGLGRFAPGEVGPMTMQAPNGVIDVLAADEAEAVATARRILALLAGGPAERWSCADQRALRTLIPEDPKRIHDARAVLETLCDTGSVIELRRAYGTGIVTALARIEGRPVGVLANDPAHLSGALDAPASEKAGRFVQLCDAFGLPIVSLVDTPGFMVGPEAESAALVRRASRMFVCAATVSVPWLCVVVRRAYGLGAQAMAGGGFHVPVLNVAWPTGEFGAMGVEGAVRLALRKELEAIEDEAEREQRVRDLVEQVRAQSGALTMAAHFEIDDVIDPADTRARLVAALRAFPVPEPPPSGRRRTMVDVW